MCLTRPPFWAGGSEGGTCLQPGHGVINAPPLECEDEFLKRKKKGFHRYCKDPKQGGFLIPNGRMGAEEGRWGNGEWGGGWSW